jgi:glycosyltransferase involved in cell wall biosynthesis
MANDNLGIVVIGRNEGERLSRCIKSAIRETGIVVYVDSGSTDNSIKLAKQLGAEVVNLDLSVPFTAARARNAGFDFLNSRYPAISYVQFIDGDCELIENWVQQALDFLNTHTQYAVVCGRRRERFPNASVYNQLCDIEWDTPIGEASACGGDALMRVKAFVQAEGYRDDLIAGEEPELSFRLRQHGWKIYRLDAEMTWHDAAITQFKQWWQRSKRAGFAYAEGSYLHGKSEEKYWLKETRSIFVWGGLLPIFLILLTIVNKWFLMGWVIYFIQIVKIAIFNLHDEYPKKFRFLIAYSFVACKFPQFIGIFSFHLARFLKYRAKIIEYK